MKKWMIFIAMILCLNVAKSIDYTGIYSFNKGINKENGTLFVFQYTQDSVFYYLSCFSGAPDFFLTNIKGFISIDSMKAVIKKDSCEINFIFKVNQFQLIQSSACNYEHPINGVYKKTSPTLKKTTTWFTEYSERKGQIKSDSTTTYFAPCTSSKKLSSLKKDDNIRVLDDINGFYLIEISNKKNDFLWVQKKNVLLSK